MSTLTEPHYRVRLGYGGVAVLQVQVRHSTLEGPQWGWHWVDVPFNNAPAELVEHKKDEAKNG